MLIIQRTACLRCGQSPIARVTTTSVLCFTCRLVQPVREWLRYPFTNGELRRLAHYRAAVRAGFYSDYLAK